MQIEPIAHFHSPFSSKFGIPKQSGLVPEMPGKIVFLPQYRDPDALRGLDGFDFVWLIWGFSANPHAARSSTVRPPVLGGNERMGVFATRSPFRPNALGLSSVRIKRIDLTTANSPVIEVLGADLMDGTPIFDIKPYLPYTDSHAEARSGFTSITPQQQRLEVIIPTEIEARLNPLTLPSLRDTLSLDPRPRYHHDPTKVYGMPFDGHDIHFRVAENAVIVVAID